MTEDDRCRSAPAIVETRRQPPANAPEATEEPQEEHTPQPEESSAAANPGKTPAHAKPANHRSPAPSHRSRSEARPTPFRTRSNEPPPRSWAGKTARRQRPRRRP